MNNLAVNYGKRYTDKDKRIVKDFYHTHGAVWLGAQLKRKPADIDKLARRMDLIGPRAVITLPVDDEGDLPRLHSEPELLDCSEGVEVHFEYSKNPYTYIKPPATETTLNDNQETMGNWFEKHEKSLCFAVWILNVVLFIFSAGYAVAKLGVM